MVTSVSLFTLVLIGIGSYRISTTFENPKEWSKSIAAKCGGIQALEYGFEYRGLNDFGDISPIFGAIYGLLASQQLTPGLLSGKVAEDSGVKVVLRVIFCLIFASPWRFFNSKVENLHIESAVINFLCCKLLWGLIQGFVLFFVADVVFHWLGLFKMHRDSGKEDEENQLANDSKQYEENQDALELDTNKKANKEGEDEQARLLV